MRTTRAILGALLALTLAACSSGATTGPSTEPSPEPSVEPAVSPAPSAAPTEAPDPLGLWVSFDGTACTYTGPLVIPDGTLVEFSYAATEGTEPSILLVTGVYVGTTWTQVQQDADRLRSTDWPDWITQWSMIRVDSGDSALMTIRSSLGEQEFGGFFVGCATAPESEGGTDRMYAAALIEVGIAP